MEVRGKNHSYNVAIGWRSVIMLSWYLLETVVVWSTCVLRRSLVITLNSTRSDHAWFSGDPPRSLIDARCHFRSSYMANIDTKVQCAVKLVSNMQYPSQHVPVPQ